MPRAMPRSRSRRAAAPRGFFGNPRLLCAYVYFEKEPDAESATKLMTRDEFGASPPTSPSCPSRRAGAVI